MDSTSNSDGRGVRTSAAKSKNRSYIRRYAICNDDNGPEEGCSASSDGTILNDKPRGGKKGIFLFLVLMRKIKSSKQLCDHFAQ